MENTINSNFSSKITVNSSFSSALTEKYNPEPEWGEMQIKNIEKYVQKVALLKTNMEKENPFFLLYPIMKNIQEN